MNKLKEELNKHIKNTYPGWKQLPIGSGFKAAVELAFSAGYKASQEEKKEIDKKQIMTEWDMHRRNIASGDKGSCPRDWFEALVDSWES